MKFRQLGILLIVGGFLSGHLISLIAIRAGLDLTTMAAGTDLTELSRSISRALQFQLYGDIVAMVGLVIYFYGVLTSRGGRNTGIVPAA